LDKSGNGFAVIRFLPAPGEEVLPYVRMFSHGFKGPTGQWFIELSRTTLGEPDPVSEMNGELWNAGQQDLVRSRKRTLSYVSNIYVVKDPSNPENEGKVFLYRYGAKIFEKIEAKMKPQFEHDQPMNPFDMWEGANFELRIITKDRTANNPKGFRNYDASVFQSAGAIGSDDEMEKIWGQEYSLTEMISPDKFKSYDELKSLLLRAVGNPAADRPDMPSASARTGSSVDPSSSRKPVTNQAEREETSPPWDEGAPSSNSPANDMDDDPDIAEYRRLAGLT
jgi:hypothetical protein